MTLHSIDMNPIFVTYKQIGASVTRVVESIAGNSLPAESAVLLFVEDYTLASVCTLA